MNDMPPIPLLALGPIVMTAIGWLLFWFAFSQAFEENHLAQRLLKIVGAVFLILGVSLTIIVNSHVISLLLLAAAGVVAISAVVRYYVAEGQSLLWVLTVAAERGIPLESAARAFAAERTDVIGRRANLLADYLEAGVPLALSLIRSRCDVSPAVQLAADLGQQTGTLGSGLRYTTSGLEAGEATLREMIERLFYLMLLLAIGSCVVTFYMLKIMPVMKKLFGDFGLETPPVTRELIAVADVLASGWISAPLILGATCVLAVTVTLYCGLSLRKLPLIGRLWWSADCSLVLHWLGVAVRRDVPISEMVRMLAAHFPQAGVRRRLERASMRIDRGQDWCDSLRAAGILRARENGLFKSAERVGNLAWALDEMAESGVRRSAYRIRAWTNVIFPIAVIALGAIVLFICAGSFFPLVTLISGLA